MPDPIFANPRLAALYDALEGERSDLAFYVSLVERYVARSVLDVGCGTGVLACLLAHRGIDVIGLDPAEASLRIARQKPATNKVQWILGDARCAPPCSVDMAMMTGNVAQVFLSNDDWVGTLSALREALRPNGTLVFETRDPERQAWRGWNRAQTYRRIDVAGIGVVTTWCDVTRVDGPLVAFRWTYEFAADGAVLLSDSTLRFRGRAEVVQSLERTGYAVEEVLDAPDRPGLELVFVARRLRQA
jgi:SAM-dependent methyltransferase